jgi:hypothetical protein
MDSNRYNIPNYEGLDIINGHGVCLNMAAMLRDVLNRAFHGSDKIITVLAQNYKPKNKYFITINGGMESFKGREGLTEKIIGNHAGVLMQIYGLYYMYDVSGQMISIFDSKMNAHPVHGKGYAQAKYIYPSWDKKEINDIMERGKQGFIPARDYLELFHDIRVRCETDEADKRFNQFYKDVKDDIDFIHDELPRCLRK